MADFNPLDPRLRSNPYDVYRELREQAPVFWQPLMQTWVLSRYDDNLAALRDHAAFSSERTRAKNALVQQLESYRLSSGPLGTTPTMLSIDPPAHTRMRHLVNKAFTPRVVERIRPHIAEIADELIDGLPQPGTLDVVNDLAIPLPMIVIAEVLGVPLSDRERFKAWSTDVANSLGGPLQAPDVLDVGPERPLEAGTSMARAFLEQGAKRVVCSQWSSERLNSLPRCTWRAASSGGHSKGLPSR